MKENKIQIDINYKLIDFELNVNLVLPDEGVIGIFGRSGSGKTSLLRCLAGFNQMNKGLIQFRNEIWHSQEKSLAPYQRGIGYVFQDPSLFSHLDVLGNLKFAEARKDVNKIDFSLEEVVNVLGLNHLLIRKVDSLSGGQKQRVAIARSIINNPNVLLMDEPLSSLDDHSKSEILEYLVKIKNQFEIPIFYVSHSIEELRKIADYLVVLNEGRIQLQGRFTEVLKDQNHFLNKEEFAATFDLLVSKVYSEFSLIEATIGNQAFLVQKSNVTVGEKFRIWINSKDVSVALNEVKDTSILNTLKGEIIEILDQSSTNQDRSILKIKVHDVVFFSEISMLSLRRLGLSKNMIIWLQVKCSAIFA